MSDAAGDMKASLASSSGDPELKGTFDQAFRADAKATEGRAERRGDEGDVRRVHPATLQMLSQMPPLLARGVIYLIVLFIVAAATWAILSETDVVVRGQGVVVPEGEGHVGQVHATVAAVVAELKVKLGQSVSAGDVLMVLQARDLEKLQAAVTQAELELTLKQQALRRLDEERKPEVYLEPRDLKTLRVKFNLDRDPAPTIDPQVVKLAARQVALEEMIAAGEAAAAAIRKEQADREAALKVEIAARERRLALMDAQLKVELRQVETRKKQTQAALEAAQESVPRLQARASAAKAEYERLRRAEGESLIETAQVSAAHLTWLSAESELATARDQVAQLPLKLAEYEVEKEQIAAREALNRADVERELIGLRNETAALPAQFETRLREQDRLLRDAKANVAAVELQWAQQRATHVQERESLLRDVERATLSRDTALKQSRLDDTARIVKAPLTGEITKLTITNPGEFVQPGQQLATIASPSATRVMHVTVANRDIAKLRGSAPGKPGMPVKLKFDAYPFQTYGVVGGELLSVSPDAVADEKQGWVYRVRASFKTTTIRGHLLDVKFGMTATVEIVQRQRSLFDVVLEPFKKLGEDLTP